MRVRKRANKRGTVATGQRRGRLRKRSGRMREKDSPEKRENRHFLQLMICCGAFVLLVVVKLLLPAQLARLDQPLLHAMEKNMDLQTVFSAVSDVFSGEKDMQDTVTDIYQAVFREEPWESAQASAILPESGAGFRCLKSYRAAVQSQETEERQSESEKTQVSELAYILYSQDNLPECVNMEQVILGFSYCSPVCGVLSSDFGYRDHPTEGEGRFHYGIDLAADTGTDIVAFAKGTVIAVGESSSYGKYCTVSHAGGYTTLYAHCSRITVSSGTVVEKGEKIAEVGETGMATGPHLHFELQQGGVYLNPIYYV